MSDEVATPARFPALMSSLGITDVEARVLVQVHVGGNMTVGAIALAIDERQPKVEKAIATLIERGLVAKAEGVVPVYHALLPLADVSQKVSSVLKSVRTVADKAQNFLTKKLEDMKVVGDDINAARKNSIELVKSALDSHDESLAKLVHDEVGTVTATASKALSDFSQRIEAVLKNEETGLEDKLGSDLLSLQGELDTLQKGLTADLDRISVEFDDSLKTRRKSVEKSFDKINKAATRLAEGARKSVRNAADTMGVVLQDTWTDLTKDVEALTTESVQRATPVLEGISDELSRSVGELKASVEQSYMKAVASLAGVLDKTRGLYYAQAESAQGSFQSSMEAAASAHQDVSSWENEVQVYLGSASKSFNEQFDRITQLDQSYHDSVLASLNAHLDKVSALLTQDYDSLKGIAQTIQEDFEKFVVDAKSSVVSTLQSQKALELGKLEKAKESLAEDLEKWSKSSGRSINKYLSAAETEVQSILDTEMKEVDAAATNMSSRLSSSYNTVLSTFAAKSEGVLSGAKASVEDLDSTVAAKISDMLSEYETKTMAGLEDAKVAYESLGKLLDERLAQSVTAIGSQAEKAQKAVDVSVADQLTRIDTHSDSIREELHDHLENLTKQFQALTQSLETSFDGLLANQTVETRDLISSLNLEFRNSVRAEIKSLKDDSIKLQQEYASDVGLKLDEVASSITDARKDLEALLQEKSGEMSQSVGESLGKMEAALKTAQDSLKEIESGTIRQLSDGMVQISKEIQSSLETVQHNVRESLVGARGSVESSLDKGISSMTSIAERFITEQDDLRQRMVADTSKRLDGVAAQSMKSSEERLESYQLELAEKQTASVQSRTEVDEEAVELVGSLKEQAAKSLESASAWFDESSENLTGAVSSLGKKLNNQLDIVYIGLAKGSNEVAKTIREQGDLSTEKVEDLTNTMLKDVELTVTNSITHMGDRGVSQIGQAVRAISSLEKSIADTMADLGIAVSSKTSERQEEVVGSLDKGLVDYRASADSVLSDLKAFIEHAENQAISSKDALLDKIHHAVIDGNVLSSRKFEATALDFRTRLSSDTLSVIEAVYDETAASNTAVTNSVVETTSKVSSESSKLRQARNDAVSKFESAADKSTKKWITEMESKLEGMQSEISASSADTDTVLSGTIAALEAIGKAVQDLSKSEGEKSWYLSGQDELRAHILDMASRAQKSIVISIPDAGFLDLKKLAKSKVSARRVLVVPQREEPDQVLEQLTGWRVWEHKSPPIVAVRDDEEILIGGAQVTDRAIALVSVDPAFLQLFHDVIGPRLVGRRKD